MMTVVSGERAPSSRRVASVFLSRQVCLFEFNELCNWVICSFEPVSYFRVLPQSK
jgi:hypothetical protein